MTERREKALRACGAICNGKTPTAEELDALTDDYYDAIAFLDAAENNGLAAAWEAYRIYCEGQGE